MLFYNLFLYTDILKSIIGHPEFDLWISNIQLDLLWYPKIRFFDIYNSIYEYSGRFLDQYM